MATYTSADAVASLVGILRKHSKKLAVIAKEEQVNEIIVESNFGDGMFNQLFMPVLNKVHSVTMSEVRHNKQKERRIIDVLEPVMNQHRLVMDKKVIQKDFDSCQHLPPEQAFTLPTDVPTDPPHG